MNEIDLILERIRLAMQNCETMTKTFLAEVATDDELAKVKPITDKLVKIFTVLVDSHTVIGKFKNKESK